MADVKLGNQTYTGVEKVKLKTADGGDALFILDGSVGSSVDDGFYLDKPWFGDESVWNERENLDKIDFGFLLGMPEGWWTLYKQSRAVFTGEQMLGSTVKWWEFTYGEFEDENDESQVQDEHNTVVLPGFSAALYGYQLPMLVSGTTGTYRIQLEEDEEYGRPAVDFEITIPSDGTYFLYSDIEGGDFNVIATLFYKAGTE